MDRKNADMNRLEERKQLLLAESELNRVQLQDHCHAISKEFGELIKATTYRGSLALAGAFLLSQLGHRHPIQALERRPTTLLGTVWNLSLKAAKVLLPSFLLSSHGK